MLHRVRLYATVVHLSVRDVGVWFSHRLEYLANTF